MKRIPWIVGAAIYCNWCELNVDVVWLFDVDGLFRAISSVLASSSVFMISILVISAVWSEKWLKRSATNSPNTRAASYFVCVVIIGMELISWSTSSLIGSSSNCSGFISWLGDDSIFTDTNEPHELRSSSAFTSNSWSP